MKINLSNIKKAKNLLNKSECVAIPTETVYGLAGNAYSKKAVIKIFKLKNRPKFNPLIIHYHKLSKINKDVNVNKNFFKLYKKFCPGPITFVLDLKKNIDVFLNEIKTEYNVSFFYHRSSELIDIMIEYYDLLNRYDELFNAILLKTQESESHKAESLAV